MTRLFEVGDLVVCCEGIGIIKRHKPFFALSPCFIEFENYSAWVKTHEIKTIRNVELT